MYGYEKNVLTNSSNMNKNMYIVQFTRKKVKKFKN